MQSPTKKTSPAGSGSSPSSEGKNRAAQELTRIRNEKLTPEERSEIASAGGQAYAEKTTEATRKRISRMGVKARKAKKLAQEKALKKKK